MDKAKINNEIILMRKDVGQVRGQLIKKLTRDSLKLRQKKGTEAQRLKNLRKAKRMIAEILEIKKIKKDEITKLVLKNTLALNEVLGDSNSKPLTRIIARIGNHKSFSTKISEFKSKYPNYMNFLGPGRKLRAKLERKGLSTMEINSSEDPGAIVENDKSKEMERTVADEESDDSVESGDDSNGNDSKCLENNDIGNADSENESVMASDCENNDINEEAVENRVDESERETSLAEKSMKIMDNTEKLKDSKPEVTKKPTDVLKAVTKQAIVKRLEDLLLEADDNSKLDDNLEISTEFVEESIDVKREIDSFFLMEDGETNYLTLASSTNNSVNAKGNSNNNNTSKFHRQRFQQDSNNSFDRKFRNNDYQFNSNKSNTKWKHQNRIPGPYERENRRSRRALKHFNNDYKDDSNSDKRYSKSNFEEKSNNTPLHPSWEAKRKQQDILKQGFQGKKIVFSDT
ncbi:PREDICTED: serum response factor-binding protein 1-like [Ceratosolen solmsi marchali]|uniref:Serum response factor-binding protein 1 n=1 Tax=Ceratosolen solmsi marchali TaxID=326594 RepID=A0AAJ6YL76_9HYME|nr:PREDICTED: serum response factor-binding protein 1-like [Ceratosolen solmsi marchali]